MHKSILTLDQATRSGFCLWKPGQPPVIGNKDLSFCGNNLAKKLFVFEEWLKKTIVENQVDFLVFEEIILIRFGTKQTGLGVARWLYSLAGTIEKVCFELDVRCSEAPIKEWRKHFLGYGGFKTDEAKELCMNKCKELGLNPKFHDEAEAFGIMDYTADLLEIKKYWADVGLLQFMNK